MVSCFKGEFRVTSPRGYRVLYGVKEFHPGLDLVGVDDISVYSISDGIVRVGYQSDGAGNYVVVTMADGKRVYYMHLSYIYVVTGSIIKKGDKLGVMGSTGRSTGAHTHLELRPSGTSYNSLDISQFTGIPNAVGTYFYKEESTMPFNDISGHYAEKEINDLLSMGIVQGDGNGNFKPNDPITRADVAIMIRRAITYITGK